MDVDSDDDDGESGRGPTRDVEDKMPPKMRKRWIRGAVERQREVEVERREKELREERERMEEGREQEREREKEREEGMEEEGQSMQVDNDSDAVPGGFRVERWLTIVVH